MSSAAAAAAPPEPLFVLRGHRAPVQCVAFTPDCRSLAAGDGEGELTLWDLGSRRAADSIRAHESHSGILQVACPAAGAGGAPCVLSQGRDGVVKCWQLHSGSSLSRQPLQQLVSGSFNFCRFALLQPGQSSSSCTCQPGAGQPACDAGSQHMLVEGFAADGSSSGSSTTTNTSSSQQPCPPRRHTQPAGLLARQLQEQQAGDALGSLQLAEGLSLGQSDQTGSDGEAGAAAAAVPGDEDDLTEAAEELLVAGRHVAGTQGGCSTSDAAGGGGPCFLALPDEDPATVGVWQLGMPSSTLGSSSSSGGGPGHAAGWQRPQLLLQQTKAAGRPSRGLCMAMALLRPQGLPLHVLAGYEDGSVALWDSRAPAACVAAQKLHSEAVMCLAAAPDCRSGLSGSADDQLAWFEVDVGRGRLRVAPAQRLPAAGLADVAFRPDGRVAASAGWDCKLRVWHGRKHSPLAVLRWHNQQVAAVGFSGDSRLLAAGGRDNCISVWSVFPPST